MKKIWLVLFVAAALSSCTKEIEVDVPDPADLLVVEGTIDIGEAPFIILTKNSPYFGEIKLSDFENTFVHDDEVDVLVYSGTDSVILTELCLNNLPLTEDEKQQLASDLGYNFDDTSGLPNICIYTDPTAFFGTGVIEGQENTTYHLTIKRHTSNELVTATTTIPTVIPLQQIEWRPHPNAEYDTLAGVYVEFTVPDTFGNFIRYWTSENSGPFYVPPSASVYDDRLFVANTVNLPLERGQDPNDPINFDTYPYFIRGDTVAVRWANIDKAHFDFWNTAEQDGGDSPFSSPITIKTNVNGGLGVWGGYASQYLSIYIPE